MFGLRPQELILIVLLIVVFYGAKKLPELGKGIGEGIKNFKKSIKETTADDSDSKPSSKEKTA